MAVSKNVPLALDLLTDHLQELLVDRGLVFLFEGDRLLGVAEMGLAQVKESSKSGIPNNNCGLVFEYFLGPLVLAETTDVHEKILVHIVACLNGRAHNLFVRGLSTGLVAFLPGHDDVAVDAPVAALGADEVRGAGRREKIAEFHYSSSLSHAARPCHSSKKGHANESFTMRGTYSVKVLTWPKLTMALVRSR